MDNNDKTIDKVLAEMVQDPKWKGARLGTYNCILLPPTKAIKTKEEGAAWVDSVFRALETTYPELGFKRPLDMYGERDRHLTLGKAFLPLFCFS